MKVHDDTDRAGLAKGRSTLSSIKNQPCETGVDSAYVSRALERISRRETAAQICVLRNGEVLLDWAIGCKKDSLFWIFSASKPLIAMLMYLLAERG